MALERICPANREEWLEARKAQGIGASEAAAIVGLNPWMSKNDLWEIKTGRRAQKDLSGNDAVERGIRMESAIRTVFQARHPEFMVEHHAYDILYQSDRPWLFATLDGEITELWQKIPKSNVLVSHGPDEEEFIRQYGADSLVKKFYPLEIKTSAPRSKADWSKWSDGKIPDNYYIQILHQMLATGWEKAYLTAFLYGKEDIIIREYDFLRKDCEADLDWLLKEETEFYKSVVSGQKPLSFSMFV